MKMLCPLIALSLAFLLSACVFTSVPAPVFLPQAQPDCPLACLLKVSPVETGEDGTPRVFIEPILFNEYDGSIVAAPKIETLSGMPAATEMAEISFPERENKTQPDQCLTRHFGVISLDGRIKYLARTTVTPDLEAGTAEVAFFALHKQFLANGILVSMLEFPSLTVTLDQPVLLLERSGAYLAIPIDPENAESVANARRWSPLIPLRE